MVGSDRRSRTLADRLENVLSLHRGERAKCSKNGLEAGGLMPRQSSRSRGRVVSMRFVQEHVEVTASHHNHHAHERRRIHTANLRRNEGSAPGRDSLSRKAVLQGSKHPVGRLSQPQESHQVAIYSLTSLPQRTVNPPACEVQSRQKDRCPPTSAVEANRSW